MPVYHYLLLKCPPGPCALPRRGLIASGNAHGTAPSGVRTWGWADYWRPLTVEETQFYGLVYVAYSAFREEQTDGQP